MRIRRVIALCVALTFVAGAPLTLSAQKQEEKKRSKQEQQDIETLVKLVDAVGAGKQAAPSDVAVTWDTAHFVKGQDGKTYIPFTLSIDASKLANPGVAMYVRVVNKQQAAATPPPAEKKDEKKGEEPAVEYPWDNVHFLEVKGNGPVPISRAMAVAGGTYDVFVAVKERTTGQRNQPPAKVGLLRHELTVPNFDSSELTTSSVILAETVEPVQGTLTPEQQQENPYTFGTMRIVPSAKPAFSKSGELQVIFWIYGVQQDAQKKPSVTVEYNFHQKLPEGEKYFNKTAPQELNAQTLPPQFDMAAGHQLPGSLVVPLASFPAGDYRLEIKITDKMSGKSMTQNVGFSVAS